MKTEWVDMSFILVEYRDSGVKILSAIDYFQVSVNVFQNVLLFWIKLVTHNFRSPTDLENLDWQTRISLVKMSN